MKALPPFCDRCQFRPPLCLCDQFAPRPTATRVVVVMHNKEALRPSNTGRLVPVLLKGGAQVIRGRPGAISATEALQALGLPDEGTALLYPDEGARDLVELKAAGEAPTTLLVPDGNWPQTRRAARREPALISLPRVTLPPGPPSRYRLRTHPEGHRLATFEAIARALGILEGPELQADLEQVFDEVVRRVLSTRRRGLRNP